MKIDIISDTICPWCFIGKRRLARALELRPQDRLEVFWHPFQLNPDMPQEGIDRGRYLADKFGGPDRAERVYDRIRAAGREEGIEFRFDLIKRTPNTVDSHRLVAYAGMHGVQDPVVEALFQAYFIDGRNVGDHAVLTEIAAAAGLDGGDVADFLAAGTDRDRIVAEDERVRTMGVSGVPCFIIDQRYAVSGAQSPEVFFQIFDLVREEQSAAAVPSAG
jgi:predicted DsbA family dithiol-disulfide isomerase